MKPSDVSNYFLFYFWVSFLLFGLNNDAESRDLKASLGYLPKILESPDKGAFVDLVKAIDSSYSDGQINIKVYPFPRSINNVITGNADFHLPMLRNNMVSEESLPYRYASAKMGKVVIVLYSNSDNPITKSMIDEALSTKEVFPYLIESNGGMQEYYKFPLKFSSAIEHSMKMVSSKRVGAALYAQEEGDFILKKLKIKNIHRSLYGVFDDVIVIPKTPAGDEIDRILSEKITELKSTGHWQYLHLKVHQPYQDWQPYD